MPKSRYVRLLAASLLAIAFLALLATGCGSKAPTASTTQTTATPVPATTTTTKVVVLDFLSTFEAKDPFVQQAVSTSGTSGGTGSTGSTSSSTGSTSSTSSSSTTSTTGGSSTTSTPSHHSMKALSINTINGVTTATIEVDGVVYQNKKVNDVVNTGWGQVKILRIDVGAQTVTVLHGSETRVLTVGQAIIK